MSYEQVVCMNYGICTILETPVLQWEEMDEANEDQKQKESAILKVEKYVID